MRVVVTAGYDKSPHAASVIELLARSSMEVVGALTVSMSTRRARYYVQQLGPKRAGRRFVRRVLGAGRVDNDLEVAPIRDFRVQHGLTATTVSASARAAGATAESVPSLSGEAGVQLLRRWRPDLVIYAGGGILRSAFLDVPTIGTLNAHAGPLPDFRGMNSSEWAVLNGVEPEITTILVDEGIDTGPIIGVHPIDGLPADSVAHLRGLSTVASVQALVADTHRFAEGDVKQRPQREQDGLQHYVMSGPVVEVLDRYLAAQHG